jgi:uncharacterized membrane protein YsdA (DUF1294 family)/cold shock CspA family protein
MRIKGSITTWNDEKGFGFITPDGGGKQVFIHISDFNNRTHRPELNQQVVYTLSHDKQNRVCAKNATLAGDKLRKKSRGLPSIIFALSFLVIVSVAVLLDKAPPLILYVYLIASLLTFLKYALDKSAAKKSKWRTPESTLHLFSIVGGWPGALIAQQILRHKSKKLSFRIVFWFTVLLNCGGVAWILTPNGIANLQLWVTKVLQG